MRVRIVRKLANYVDGIDLSHYTTGQVVELPDRDARMVMAEEWATPARRDSDLSPDQDRSDVVGRRTHDDRRSPASPDLYRRLQDKRDQIDRDRRCRDRRHAA